MQINFELFHKPIAHSSTSRIAVEISFTASGTPEMIQERTREKWNQI
jgi:hypothetical protein